MPLAAVFALLFRAAARPGLNPNGERQQRKGKGPLLSFQCNGQSIQACADMPVLACAFWFCYLLFVLTAANNCIIPLQKYFWEMGIFESTEVIGGRCRFPPPTPLYHVSVQIQTAFLPHSPLKLKRLKFFTRKVILS